MRKLWQPINNKKAKSSNMKIHELLDESVLVEMRTRFNTLPSNSEIPGGTVIFAYRDSIWVVTPSDWKDNKNRIVDDIKTTMDLPDGSVKDPKWYYNPEMLIDIAKDNKNAIVFFTNDEGELLFNRNTFAQSPSSPLVRKTMKFMNRYFGISDDDIQFFASGVNVSGLSPSETPRKTTGLPKTGYHGTNLDSMLSIIKKGIAPQESGNFGKVHTPGYIFFAADNTPLVQKYAMHTTGNAYNPTSFPVIVHFNIPDQNMIRPDVDIAHDIYGKDAAKVNPDYQHLDFPEKEQSFRSTKGVKRPEKMWQHAEVFGYKGRIPASQIVGFSTPEPLGGANTSKQQMIENLRAWRYLKQKFNPADVVKATYKSVSWKNRSAEDIVKQITAELDQDTQNGQST